jgi:fermentation-respiration switch protein FrsA (DUF1100 family)
MDDTPRSSRAAGRLVRRTLAALVGAAALAAGATRLDGRFLYFPPTHDEAAWRATAARTGAEPLELVRDDAVLRGWLLRPAAAGDARLPTVLYFGGNAEDASWLLDEAARLGPVALAIVPYRGYGASTGVPRERRLYDDALAAYDALAARPDVDARRISVWGRSLGTGVATWLAAKRPVESVVLSTPFDSIAALARLHAPLLSPLLRQRFDSVSRAPSIRVPMLAVIAGRDTVVPPAHGERLVAAWGGPTRVLRLPQASHDDVQVFPEHWREIARFLASPSSVARP